MQPPTKTPPLHDRVPRILSGICCWGLASCILFFLYFSLQFLINNVPLSALSSPAPTSRIRQTNKREQFISDDVQRANERISKGRRIQIESLALGAHSIVHTPCGAMKLSCLLFIAQPVTRAPLDSFLLFVSTSVYAFYQLCMCAHGIRFLLLNSFKMLFKKSILPNWAIRYQWLR